jgi:hypothetical protein
MVSINDYRFPLKGYGFPLQGYGFPSQGYGFPLHDNFWQDLKTCFSQKIEINFQNFKVFF